MAKPFSVEMAVERGQRQFMPEIQALRAIAVGLVVAFHLYPQKWFTGGFVGVDVFFVISGYLITTHLLREVDAHGTIRLLSFYARRIRRLLPASLSVLVITMVAAVFWLPVRYLLPALREAIAATCYVENLWLAAKAVTYSASNDLASPLQHYWSLSTEEQFYLLWPALMILGLWLGRRLFHGHTARAMGGVLVVFFTVSLVFALVFTPANPAAAYFITPTRVWQFATGALTAFLLRWMAPGKGVDLALRWGGLAMILASAVMISQADPFPGWRAIPPTLGAALVIIAGDTGKHDPLTVISDLGPVQWIGDISYSIYLWHWPLIVLTPYLVHGPLLWWHKAVILVLSCALAHLTRLYVEIPGQLSPWLRKSNLRTFAATAIAMGLIAGGSFGYGRYVAAAGEDQRAEVNELVTSDRCLGAGARLHPGECPDAFAAPPRLEVSESDAPWGFGCSNQAPCWEGERPAKVLALVGDSHAESLYWAVAPLAQRAGWGIYVTLQGGCPPNYEPSTRFKDKERAGIECADAARATTEELRTLAPDLIVAAAYRDEGFVSNEAAIAGYQQVFADWLSIAPVAVIQDYPVTGGRMMPECLAMQPYDPLACTTERSLALPTDLMYRAAEELGDPRIQLVDLTEVFCDERTCYSVVGGLPVYYDADHINRIFGKTLAPVVAEQLDLPGE